MRLPKLRELKHKAGRRLRAALVPELRDLADELETLSIAHDGTQRIMKETLELVRAQRDELHGVSIQLDRWTETAERLERREDRLESFEAEIGEHEQRLEDYDTRLDDLEMYDIGTMAGTVEELEELPNEWTDLAARVQRLEELRSKLFELLND